MLKQQIATTIYASFANWAKGEGTVCQQGCCTCCTCSVNITSLEGTMILGHLRDPASRQWLTGKLQAAVDRQRPAETTNEFAASCLTRSGALPPAPPSATERCPFLDNGSCMIYPVRPFACRCLVSRTVCSMDRPATISPRHLAGATVTMQLLEHLDQGRFWGNMLDILDHLLPAARSVNGDRQAGPVQQFLRRARPLPGFVLSPADHEAVSPLLLSIMDAEVEGVRLIDIFNGQEQPY